MFLLKWRGEKKGRRLLVKIIFSYTMKSTLMQHSLVPTSAGDDFLT